MAIFLSSLKSSIGAIRRAIEENDSAFLSFSVVSKLISFLPTREEIDLIQSYLPAHRDRLGNVEKFFLELGEISHLKIRLEAMHIGGLISSKLADISSDVTSLSTATTAIRTATSFPSLLQIILRFGNFLNANTAKGNARAFRVCSLSSFTSVRSSTDQKVSLMSFFVEFICANHRHLTSFLDEVAPSGEAAKFDLAAMITELAKLKSSVDTISELVDRVRNEDEKLGRRLKEMITPAAASLRAFEEKFNAIKMEFVKLLEYYGEDTTLTCAEFFGEINQFSCTFMKSWKEIQLSNQRKELQEKRQQEKEKRQIELKNKKSTQSAVVDIPMGEDGMVDQIFQTIRGGDFRKRRCGANPQVAAAIANQIAGKNPLLNPQFKLQSRAPSDEVFHNFELLKKKRESRNSCNTAVTTVSCQ